MCVCQSLSQHLSREPGTNTTGHAPGNKKKNIKRLEEILGAKVAVHQDEKLERNEVRVVVS